MTGVLNGIRVIDLSWGVAGPMATMLLADNAAQVTRIESPQGDPFEGFSGNLVWSRGKRSAVLDLRTDEDRATFHGLVRRADVLVESFAPATAARLGVTWEQLREINPRLVHCSITGYGETGEHADRPAYDALVAARTGQQWEHRGQVGGTLSLISGGEGMLPGMEPPTAACWVGPPRKGPLFGGVPWPSVATAYNATLAISAALRARGEHGPGQHVHTSLLQGVLGNTVGPWQRIENHEAPALQSWVIDPRAPKGFFTGADGRWLHHWVPLPGFILGASAGPELGVPPEGGDFEVSAPKAATLRVGVAPEDMVILQHYDDEFRAAVGRFDSADWVRLAAEVGVPVQPVRSPEEALLDPAFLADGCVVEVEDPELGPLRQVGSVYRLSACPTDPPAPRAVRGQHTEEVRAEAAGAPEPDIRPGEPTVGSGRAPLAGIRVLDLGLAVAGPFGTQLLADLGADVIKVNTRFDGYWFASHLAMCCNHGKRSIALDLKRPEAMQVLHELVAQADIVQHNMRYDAAERLGIDYESLRAVKPDLIYCHTRGFERGEREALPGNDQTGAALAGTEWLDGGTDDGGRPIWSVMSAGDTGNGWLSAIGMVQALYHRDRTGEGQFVDTSILYAHLLNASMSWSSPDGATVAGRPSLDGMQYGWNALYGLYPTSDGWLCIAAMTGTDREALFSAVGRPDLTPRFGHGERSREQDRQLREELVTAFAARPAAEWFDLLDAAGVPCEISSTDFVQHVFDDPDLQKKGWVASFRHDVVGRMDVAGLLFDLEANPGAVAGPPPVVGRHTLEILGELGYSPEQGAALVATAAAFDDTTAPRPT